MRDFKLIIGIILSLILLGSCSNTIESKIASKLKQCEKSVCEIDITELTNFKWDTAYYFEIPVSQDIINKMIGIEYQNYKEFTRPLIFIKNRKIVYSENNPSGVESITKNQIVFNELTDTAICKIISSSNSKFKGYKEKNSETTYYRLE